MSGLDEWLEGEKLARGRFFKNGNGFSTGHLLLNPKCTMIDVDKIRIQAELSVSRENSLFVEYKWDFQLQTAKFGAMFSLKHNQSRLSTRGAARAFDFVENIQNKVLREMARQLGMRLFLVFHGEKEQPPFDIHEIDVVTGAVVRRAFISGNKESAWEKAWEELGLKSW